MSNGDENSFNPAGAFMKMWSDMASTMIKAGTPFAPDSTPPEMARQMRSAMVSAWADYCDQFMRSDAFREMMKQSLAGAVQARRQLNDFLGQAQHELQGASRQDVDQLMLSLRHIERRVVDGIERLSERLDGIDRRLTNLEASTASEETPRKNEASGE